MMLLVHDKKRGWTEGKTFPPRELAFRQSKPPHPRHDAVLTGRHIVHETRK